MTTRSIKKGTLVPACLLLLNAFWGFTPAQPAQNRERASFPHEKEKHRALDCSKCHSVSAARPDVRNFPGHVTCISCHNFALESLFKPVTFCGICHAGRAASKSQSALFDFPKPQAASDFGIDFSHPAHLKPFPGQTPKCTDCHRRVEPVRAAMPEMLIETGHSTCFKCHGENPIRPPGMNQCADCHKINGPHAPHLFAVVEDFKHEDHEYDIRPRKKKDYPITRPPDYLCSECHNSVALAEALDSIKLPEENYCNQCHNGRLGLPEGLSQGVLNSLRRR